MQFVKISSVFYLGSARERVKRRRLISDVSANNISGQHRRVEWDWFYSRLLSSVFQIRHCEGWTKLVGIETERDTAFWSALITFIDLVKI